MTITSDDAVRALIGWPRCPVCGQWMKVEPATNSWVCSREHHLTWEAALEPGPGPDGETCLVTWQDGTWRWVAEHNRLCNWPGQQPPAPGLSIGIAP